jgi:hypothetical protein
MLNRLSEVRSTVNALRSALVLMLLAMVAGCAPRLPTGSRFASRSEATSQPLQEEMRALGKEHCAPCHVGSAADAKPGALAVFDLDRACWSRGMSASQLEGFVARLGGELDDRTRPHLLAFVARELSQRAGR